MSGLQTLQQRCYDRDLKFARKCSTDSHFKTWFPLNPVERRTRNPLLYKETRARTQRLFNSPIHHMSKRRTHQPDPTLNVSTHSSFEDKYWEARKSLRVWPVPEPNRVFNLISFLQDRLRLQKGRVGPEHFTLCPVDNSASNAGVVDQVVVVFNSVRLRDEVKSLAKNLASSNRSVGIQLEAPDHLRSHYQTLQKLGYHIKRKHTALRRNVKFDDLNMTLVMDVKLAADPPWKTIDYQPKSY